MPGSISRRRALQMAGAAAALPFVITSKNKARRRPARAGNVNHSACKWCYPDQTVEELAAFAAEVGMVGIDLLDPADFPTLEAHGLVCTMANGPGGIVDGWNRIENHEQLIDGALVRMKEVADAGYENMIVFSGNRRGMSDEQGLANCATGLRQIMPEAERLGVTVHMELLNSKVNHPDYMCDTSPWGVALVDAIGSEHFKLLYDIYHMQIMEGDVIRTIRDFHPYFGHYHTGGNPGRNEIDESQELYYPAIMRAIVETGFDKYVAQEFVPTRDPLTSLREAIAICDV